MAISEERAEEKIKEEDSFVNRERETEECLKVIDNVREMSSGDQSVIRIFSDIQSHFLQEHSIHEVIRGAVQELDQCTRTLITHFSSIHSLPQSKYKELCCSSEPLFKEIRTSLCHLKEVIPNNSYYRYHDHWRVTMQKLSFLCSLKVYLEQTVLAFEKEKRKEENKEREEVDDRLATKETVATLIGVCTDSKDGFHLELDDYLVGLLTLASELSRLAINSVILGDYHSPFEISTFVSQLSSGFRLLNLKNDSLRRRFDALKYDVKKIEEIIYDLTIRGLAGV